MRYISLFVLLISYQLSAGVGAGYSSPTPLPVQLVLFSASVTPNGVALRWTTATEVNNYGFEIERASFRQNETTPLQEWEKVGFVNGNGNSNSKKEYTYTDYSGNKSYVYRLKQIDNNGSFKYSPVIEADGVYELSFKLEQNYPNPFNPSTVIAYQVSTKSLVTLKIYDMLGREIVTLVNSELEAGQYSVSFNGSGYSSGVYYYEVIAGEQRSMKKMTLIK